jgi:hypothetical protein
MSYKYIKIEDLNMMFTLINYLHHKIHEGSEALGENQDVTSDELIHLLSEFVDIETYSLQQCIEKAA